MKAPSAIGSTLFAQLCVSSDPSAYCLVFTSRFSVTPILRYSPSPNYSRAQRVSSAACLQSHASPARRDSSGSVFSTQRIFKFSLPRNWLFLFLLPFSLHATQTMECGWSAAYFDVLFVNNYGGDDRLERYVNDVAVRTNVIIRLDSLLRSLRKEGKLVHFRRWTLIDSYTKQFSFATAKTTFGMCLDEDTDVFINLTDSISINRALKQLWNIQDVEISPNKQAGMWLYSLHTGLSKTRSGVRSIRHSSSLSERPDRDLLWLKCEGGFSVAHSFFQHETDGYWHAYTGLYLTTKNVLEAQRLLLENNNLKTTITSHYITPAIIKKYAHY